MAKKRANGEGNIRKRKDGRWEGRYTAGVDPETGKPIAKSVLARTQRECKEKLQKAMEELEKIDVTKRRDYTVGEWAQLWYENYAKPSVRASTAAYYKNYIDQHIVPHIGDVKLTALTTLQIQKFYNETKAHGRVQRYEKMDDLSLSNKTIRGLHTMLRQCLEQAVTERLIPYNPANGCRLPKKEKKKMQIIPPEKIRDGQRIVVQARNAFRHDQPAIQPRALQQRRRHGPDRCGGRQHVIALCLPRRAAGERRAQQNQRQQSGKKPFFQICHDNIPFKLTSLLL